MSSTEVSLAKNNASIVPTGKTDNGFTNESAVEFIRKQEAKIQSAAKTRPSERPINPMEKNVLRIESPIMIMSPMGGFSGVPFLILDNIPMGLIASAIGFIPAIFSCVLHETGYSKKVYPKVFRKKFAKLDVEHQANLRLWELKEKEYKKAESKALRKAQPALDYLNAQMNDKEFKFNDNRRDERFVLTPLPLNDYDKVLIEVGQKPSPSSLNTSPLIELEDSLSQLESTIKSDSLTIEHKESSNV